VTNLLLGTRLTDMTSGFQLFTAKRWRLFSSRDPIARVLFPNEMKAHCRDLKVVEVPIQYRSPTHVVGSARRRRPF